MANICTTDIVIDGKATEIKNLYKHFQKAMLQKEPSEKSYNNIGLNTIYKYLGLNPNNYYCRGYIDYYELDDCSNNYCELNLTILSAWTPLIKSIKLMQEKYAPNATFEYFAVEEGCDLYQTNKCESYYCVDIWHNGDIEKKQSVDDSTVSQVVSVLMALPYYSEPQDIEEAAQKIYGEKLTYD